MLTQVDVTNSAGSVLSLPLEDISSGFLVKEILGLDPVKATISSSGFSNLDGSQYNSAVFPNRNILMKLGLRPDWTNSVWALRSTLYQYLMPKTPISLRFYTSEGLTVDIPGRVEDCSCPLWQKDPEANISIINFDPHFIDPTPVTFSGSTVTGSTLTTVTYSGSTETGFTLVLNVNRTMSEFTIYVTNPDGRILSMDYTGSLVSGDAVTITTVPGSKAAILTHSGSDSSVIYNLTQPIVWPSFAYGVNHIRVVATGAAVPYTVTYSTRYGGL
jgi:hypothetical protein